MTPDYTQSPTVPDYMQPDSVPDYMQPDPAPDPQPVSKDAKAVPDAQSGVSSPLLLVKGEDLALLPGVPVSDSNPTAQPWIPVKTATDLAAGNKPANKGSPATASGSSESEDIAEAKTGKAVATGQDQIPKQIESGTPPTLPSDKQQTGGNPQAGPRQSAVNPEPNKGGGNDAVTAGGNQNPVADVASTQQTLEQAEPNFSRRPYDALMDAERRGLLPKNLSPEDLEALKKTALSIQQGNLAREGLKTYYIDNQGKFYPGTGDPVAAVDSAVSDGILDPQTGAELRSRLLRGEAVDFTQYNSTYARAIVHGNDIGFESGSAVPRSDSSQLSIAGANPPNGRVIQLDDGRQLRVGWSRIDGRYQYSVLPVAPPAGQNGAPLAQKPPVQPGQTQANAPAPGQHPAPPPAQTQPSQNQAPPQSSARPAQPSAQAGREQSPPARQDQPTARQGNQGQQLSPLPAPRSIPPPVPQNQPGEQVTGQGPRSAAASPTNFLLPRQADQFQGRRVANYLSNWQPQSSSTDNLQQPQAPVSGSPSTDDTGQGGPDEARMQALSKLSGAQLRAQVSAGQLSGEDMHAVVKRQAQMAQEAADRRDNGVGAARDFTTRLFAKNSELMNRGAEGIAHWAGLEGAEDWFKRNADVERDEGSGKFGNANPAMNDSVHGAVFFAKRKDVPGLIRPKTED